MSDQNAYTLVIPARHASARLPGKVLLDIAGKTLLQHVWERAGQSGASEIIIATDDERVAAAARNFGAEVAMTDPRHTSGSDRIAELAARLGWAPDTVVVNLQGDEPLMPGACLDQVANLLRAHPQAAAATLYWPIEDPGEVNNPNVVKVVVDATGRALLFSRAAIPFPRDHDGAAAGLEAGLRWRRHLGLYAYRAKSLLEFTNLAPGELEQAEHLEQLRYLEAGKAIVLEQACLPIPPGVDTREDLERIRNVLKL